MNIESALGEILHVYGAYWKDPGLFYQLTCTDRAWVVFEKTRVTSGVATCINQSSFRSVVISLVTFRANYKLRWFHIKPQSIFHVNISANSKRIPHVFFSDSHITCRLYGYVIVTAHKCGTYFLQIYRLVYITLESSKFGSCVLKDLRDVRGLRWINSSSVIFYCPECLHK